MIQKKSSVLLPLGIAGVVVAGGATAYWLLIQRQAGFESMPVGANVIPQDALMTVSLSTDPQQWQKLEEFGTPESRAAFAEMVTQWRDRLLTENGYNYEQDIQPWVGKEITLAWVNPPAPTNSASSATPAVPGQQSLVMVLPIQNLSQAQQALEKSQGSASTQWSERVYKGVSIREAKKSPTETHSATVLDQRFVVISTSPQVTDQAIDTYKGGAALSNLAGYAQAANQVQINQPFAKAYINIPATSAVVSANSAKPIAPQTLSQLQQSQGLAATIAVEPEGIRFQSMTWLKPNSGKRLPGGSAVRTMPTRLPESTVVMTSGSNLQQFWQEYAEGAKTSPIAPLNPAMLQAGVKATTGLDLNQDLLPWMNGEFSLSLLPATTDTASHLPAGFVLMAQASDRRAAETAFQKLDQAMKSRYRFQVEQTKVGEQPITRWTLPDGGAIASHGWLDGNVAFFTLGAPVMNEILPRPKASLAESESFRKTVSSPTGSNGYFFIDVERASALNLLLPQMPPDSKTLVNTIRTIGITSDVQDERSMRYNGFVWLRKAEQAAQAR